MLVVIAIGVAIRVRWSIGRQSRAYVGLSAGVGRSILSVARATAHRSIPSSTTPTASFLLTMALRAAATLFLGRQLGVLSLRLGRNGAQVLVYLVDAVDFGMGVHQVEPGFVDELELAAKLLATLRIVFLILLKIQSNASNLNCFCYVLTQTCPSRPIFTCL